MSSTASGRRAAHVALFATLAIQIVTSVTATAPAVLAPVLAPDIGIAPRWIGVFVGLLYVGAMAGSLAGGEFVARFGAIRVSQIAVGICGAGLAAMALTPGSASLLLIVAAIAIGVGYGPITAASSELLARTTPPERLALTFSIKQTGVPAGAAIAGALLPALALLAGWRAAFLAVAAVGLVVIFAAEPTRRALDLRHPGHRPFSLASIGGPLKTVWQTPRLRELSLAGFAFAAVQVCLSSFLVVFLTDGLNWSIVTAGLALTCATSAAVPGRIFWGAAADRVLTPTRILALIGGLSCVFGATLAFATPGWPVWVILPLAAAYGATAIGWNGVQLSELARRAPAGTAASVTGASGFITFGGVVAGPVLFAILAGLSGGYRAGFLISSAVSGIAAFVLLRRGSA